MSDQTIPETFLKSPAPNATLHKLDFTQTIPKFQNNFAAVVDNLLTESECKQLLRIAEASTAKKDTPPTWEPATINAGGGKQVMSVASRNSDRIILDSPELADRLLARLMPFLRECGIDCVQNMPRITGLGPAKRGEVMRLSRLNERLRFLKYEGGGYFRPHWDACYTTPDGKEKSLFTVHLYLNGDGEQDMGELEGRIEKAEEEHRLRLGRGDSAEIEGLDIQREEKKDANETLLGGATSFMAGINSKEVVRVFPKTGSVLIFQQRDLFHGGDDVFRGTKYTVRTDVLYVTE